MLTRSQVLGAIYGHLVGDAFGVPYEFLSPSELPSQLEWRGFGTHRQPPGTWSDDGALMLCHVASLVERRRFDPDDVGRRFVRWLREGYMAAGGEVFDVGRTTAGAIRRLEAGVPPLEAGLASESDNGNGSLMRILPVVLWTCGEPIGVQVEACHQASRLTHGHPCAQAFCAWYGLQIRHLAADGARVEAWEKSLADLQAAYAASPDWSAVFAPELARAAQLHHPTGGGFVVDCLCSAWAAVRDAGDYTDAVHRAVRFGNDTDTTAAVAGSLAGLIFGLDSIPARWRDDLRLPSADRELIEAFADLGSARLGGRAV